MDQKETEDGKRKVVALVDGIDYAMFTTRGEDEAALHARPMAYRKVEDDGDLWFFTKNDSRKVRELTRDPRVLVSFADPKDQTFVSISGQAEVVDDREKVSALWNEIYRAWFPGGVQDPNVVLVRVRAEHAEYWDNSTSVMVYAFGYLKAAVTGKPARAGDVGVVEIA